MAIDKKQNAVKLGGGAERWKYRSVYDAMGTVGFDPSEAGSEWVLVATDLHCYYEGGSEVAGDFDQRIHDECAKMSSSPPDRCAILGDVLTGLVGSYGAPADTVDGTLEVAAANKGMLAFTNLATTHFVLGNHDTPPNESPLGDFIATNLTAFTSLNHSFDVGGVKFVLISDDHDAGWQNGQGGYLTTQLQSLNTTQECVIGMHHYGGGRAYDHRGYFALFDAVPSGLTNPLWQISGHDHKFQQSSCHSVGSTSIARQKIGAGGGAWLTFGADKIAMMAMLCRDGKVVGRLAWYGDTQEWSVLKDFDRSNPENPPSQFDGLSNEIVLSSYNEGDYDRTGRLSSYPSPPIGEYRIAGTWLAYVYNLTVNFPIPNGATKFWMIVTAANTTIEMSDDGSTWQAVTIPALVDSALILDIPVGFQNSNDLHVRLTGGGRHISAWGFAQ